MSTNNRKPESFGRHVRGDGKRFHAREYNGGLYQVYAVGLEHVCECTTCEMADMICEALETVADLRKPITRRFEDAAKNLE